MNVDTISPGEIVQELSAHKDALMRLGVRHLAVFGSRVRGDAKPDSDLDVVVQFAEAEAQGSEVERRIAAARVELAVSGMLSEICNVDVSVIERKRLSPEFAGRIADDLVEVF